MVEQDARAGKQAIGLAVVGHLPEGGGLGDGVGAARAKRGGFHRPGVSPVSPKHSPEPAL